MQVSYRAYPHPVLSYFSDDYVRCHYQTNVMTTVSRNSYGFALVSKTSSRSLATLLAAGKAVHALHIECAATRYRKLFTWNTDSFNIDIPGDKLDGRVELCSFIVAAQDLGNYSSEEFHPDFGGRGFIVRKGDVLAVDKDRAFIAEKEHDPLRKLPSIFTIRNNLASAPPPIDMDSAGHKVVIQLSEDMYSVYKKLSADIAMSQILSSMIIVPALISLLEIINAAIAAQEFSEIEEKRWYRVLATKLKEVGYAIDDATSGFSDSTLVIAQKLIGNPLQLGLPRLVTLFEDSGEEE